MGPAIPPADLDWGGSPSNFRGKLCLSPVPGFLLFSIRVGGMASGHRARRIHRLEPGILLEDRGYGHQELRGLLCP